MVGVRNYRIAAGNLTQVGNRTLYTVPTGFVLVFKSLLVANSGTGQTKGSVSAVSAGLVAVVLVDWDLNFPGHAQLQTWAALNPGDVLQSTLNLGSAYYWISGALLPGFTGVPAGPGQLPA